MEKMEYTAPEIKTVELQSCMTILAGSGGIDNGGNIEKDPNPAPFSRRGGYSDDEE